MKSATATKELRRFLANKPVNSALVWHNRQDIPNSGFEFAQANYTRKTSAKRPDSVLAATNSQDIPQIDAKQAIVR